MNRVLPLIFATACAPPNPEIGELVWTMPDTGHTLGVVGPLGQSALVGANDLTLLDAGGALQWSSVCASCGAAAFDRDGNVYTTARADFSLRFEKHVAVDGSVEWTHTFPEDTPAHVVVDGTGVIWIVLNSEDPIDFGGGVVGVAGARAYFARFDASGTFLLAQAFDFIEIGAAALPDSGIVINRTSVFPQLIAVDETGATRWTYDEPTKNFVVHANGEVTVARASTLEHEEGLRLARLDADTHGERWNQKLTSTTVGLTTVADGVIVTGTDSVADARNADVTTLEHFDSDGHRTRQIGDVDDPITLLIGPELDEFRYLDKTSITARRIR